MIRILHRSRHTAMLIIYAFLLGSLGQAARAQTSCGDPKLSDRLPETCQKERISASGNQRPTTFWAIRSARDHWKDQVLMKYGERYARWDQSACAKEECVPASLGGFKRCTLTAYPCVKKPGPVEPEAGLTAREVRDMQRLLNHLVPKARLRVDGEFGPKTLDALERWQRANGHQVDGLADRLNLERLRKAG